MCLCYLPQVQSISAWCQSAPPAWQHRAKTTVPVSLTPLDPTTAPARMDSRWDTRHQHRETLWRLWDMLEVTCCSAHSRSQFTGSPNIKDTVVKICMWRSIFPINVLIKYSMKDLLFVNGLLNMSDSLNSTCALCYALMHIYISCLTYLMLR